MTETLVDRPAPDQDPAPGGRSSRWAVWRSPADQPPWARPALLGIAAVAAVLYGWNLWRADYAPLYSDAVRAMSESWKAFFYGAVDANSTHTLDKLAGSFVPQAISARIFGYHEWSLALPQVIEGVVSVLVMYRVVRRWAGVAPGLLAAGVLTITPVCASLFGRGMEDAALIMCLLLAADCYQRAVLEGRLRSLVWSGVWIGVGFQAKMGQAWVVLPALALGYLLTAPGAVSRRLKHLGVAGLVTLVVSVSWVALYTLTPASDRPYITGSTNNSAIAMVFGYNGLGRVGIQLPGAEVARTGPVINGLPEDGDSSGEGGEPAQEGGPGPEAGQAQEGGPGQEGAQGGQEGGPGQEGGQGQEGGGEGGPQGSPGQMAGGTPDHPSKAESRPDPALEWYKLFDGHLGVAIAWLFPLALLTLVFGFRWSRRAERTDAARGGLVVWGVWLLTFGVILSLSFVPHTAYAASLAPPIAALTGYGLVLFWRAYRSGGARAWVLPAVVAVQTAWAGWLWSHYPKFLTWALWIMVALGVFAVAALVLGRVRRTASGGLVKAGLVLGVAAVLAAPATYAFSVLDAEYSGNSFDANAGPASGSV
ncbi:GT39-family glycosyltransferase [Actinokineospora auranticolor]|uniref:Dolichyl-phosphate-mannose-protein mannosyltransferase n=1 Tax=Actinokineospora auranticolor TaxID=155976 RepID=A0A2S6GUA0_9PSEU|nr:glycosyltransferase family 39 protein [Actinokineospora auranticolor]PPK68818.1 dolichyl-phosphate-mannose-protein mannosyltransferase [Actinokineospora auranticolor]